MKITQNYTDSSPTITLESCVEGEGCRCRILKCFERTE